MISGRIGSILGQTSALPKYHKIRSYCTCTAYLQRGLPYRASQMNVWNIPVLLESDKIPLAVVAMEWSSESAAGCWILEYYTSHFKWRDTECRLQ